MEEPEFYICNVCYDSATAWWPKRLSPDHREVSCLKCNESDLSICVKELEEFPPVNNVQTMDIVSIRTNHGLIERAIIKRQEKAIELFAKTTKDDHRERNTEMNAYIEITDRLKKILEFQKMIKLKTKVAVWD